MKKLVTSYTFDASEKTIVAADFTGLEVIQLITNVTDNIIIYNFADATKGGTLSGTTLTLAYDTTSMADADKLQIFVDVATQPVSAASLPLPTGASTSAKQDTIIGHVDGIEGLLGTIDADTGSLAGTVSGSELQVDIVSAPTLTVNSHAVTNAGTFAVQNTAALPAGTNAIGKLAANDGVDIGDVTLNNTSVAVTQSGTWDEVGINDSGNSITIDNATLTSLAAAINSNKVDVNIASGSSAGTEYTEDAAAAANPVGGMTMARRKDTLATDEVSADGDNIALNATNKGQLHVKLADTVIVDGSGSTQPVSGTVTANIGTVGTLATAAKQDTIIGHLDGVEGLLTDIEADTDTLAVVGGGTEAAAQRVTIANDSTGVLSVDDNGGSITVDNAALTELASAINSNLVDVNIVSGAGSGGTAQADDADFTAGTTQGTPAMGVYESTPTSVTDGDLGTVGITQGRRLKTSATIDAALPAGTNAIGKLAANSGVDIGDVDVTTVGTITPGTAATSLGKAEDAAHSSGDVGVMMLGVRNGSLTDFTGTNGDYSPIATDSRGVVWTWLTDGSGNAAEFNTSGDGLKVSLTDDAGNPIGESGSPLHITGEVAHDAADSGNPVKVGGYAKAAAPTDVSADGDRVNAWFLRNGSQATTLTAAGALIGGDATNGLDVDVTRLPALVAGTANIGDVDIFSNTAKDGSGTRYQPLVDTDGHLQVDVLSGGGGGTQYTEGDTDASITGTAMLWEDGSDTLRAVSAAKPLPVDLQDTTVAVTQSGTWDEVGINDSGNSITVDNGGTFATQVDGAALTSLQLIDDIVYTDDTSTHATGTSKGALIMAAAAPTDAAVNANDIGAVGMTANRELYVSLTTALPAGSAAIGKLAANSGVDIGDVDITSIAAGDNNIGNVDIVSLPASTNTLEVVGDVADDVGAAGNPVGIGLVARTTNRTAVSDGDAVRAAADDMGRQVTVAGQVRDLIVDQTTTITSSTSETTILTAAASTFHDMTAIMLINTSATATRVDIRDDTAGTIRMSFYLPAGDTRGMVLTRPRPQTAVNKNWTAQCSTSVDGVRIWIQAEKNV